MKNINEATVLVVDDDEVNRIVLQKLFNKENIMAFFAENAKEGMRITIEKKPTLILLDIFMPGEDGFDFLKRLKKNRDLTGISIFIFSILSDSKKIEEAYAMGADGYIPKPFNMKETVIKVKEILRN